MTDLLHTLRTWGRLPAAALLDRLGVSRATLMRAVRAAGDEVIVKGQARRTTYAARRALRGRVDPLALYRVDEHGAAHEQALLHLTYPDGTAADFQSGFPWPLLDADMRHGWFDGLPYPLYDMRPQGFLGRHFAREHAAALQVNENPERWSDDDVVHALGLLGADAPGDFILGDAACRLWLERLQTPLPAIDDDDVATRYPELADRALRHGAADSSAGGEFPKFTALRRRADASASSDGADGVEHVLVKFSGADDSPSARRWSDLLVCEHLASRVIATELAVDAAVSRIHQAGGRTFLEVSRFDRHGRSGRSGLCAWSTLDAALFGGNLGAWPASTARLVGAGLLDDASWQGIARLWHFGGLIVNTDMHDGNLSFMPAQPGGTGLRVAPAYDMLPMLYAPQRGVELVDKPYVPALPLPAEREAWRVAARAALAFWRLASEDARIGADFRALCRRNEATLRALASHPAVA